MLGLRDVARAIERNLVLTSFTLRIVTPASPDYELDSLYQLRGDALFSPCSFHGEVDFSRVCVDGLALFTRIEFRQESNFNNAQLRGGALFRPANFGGEVDFGHILIDGDASFNWDSPYQTYLPEHEALWHGPNYKAASWECQPACYSLIYPTFYGVTASRASALTCRGRIACPQAKLIPWGRPFAWTTL
jgi:Pentapeptide repeats (9 copies)